MTKWHKNDIKNDVKIENEAEEGAQIDVWSGGPASLQISESFIIEAVSRRIDAADFDPFPAE